MKTRTFGALLLVAAMLLMTVGQAASVSGAGFTTFNEATDGNKEDLCKNSVINCNIYSSKFYVWLNGGPLANGLGPDGDYFFAVLEPGGQPNPNDQGGVLDKNLSDDFDEYTNRTFTVTDGEVSAYSGLHDMDSGVKGGPPGTHPDGEIPYIRLYPYADTTNPGGVYILAICSLADGVPVDPRACKYDAFKVREEAEFQFGLEGFKFRDDDKDGFFDEEELGLSSWTINISGTGFDGESISDSVLTNSGGTGYWSWDSPVYTGNPNQMEPASLTICEVLQDGWRQIPISLVDNDGNPIDFGSGDVTLDGDGFCYEVEIPVSAAYFSWVNNLNFGNIPQGDVSGGKYYDSNANGQWDEGEEWLEGWEILYDGSSVFTGADGMFALTLDPATYDFAEVPGIDGWLQTGNTVNQSVIEDGDATVDLEDFVYTVFLPNDEPSSVSGLYFGNVCTAEAGFGTKGYWHNKNGLAELTEADRDYVNGIPPYASPSTYFDAGDEPFDGLFEDGTPVDAVNGEWGEEIAPAGSWKAEVSHFLVDPNAGGDPHEQLAQQLLAFIFNVRLHLGGEDVMIMVDGQWVAAGDLIDAAIDVWLNGDDATVGAVASMLDGLNNLEGSPGVPYLVPYPEGLTVCGGPYAPALPEGSE
jgi:hypothetical protein